MAAVPIAAHGQSGTMTGSGAVLTDAPQAAQEKQLSAGEGRSADGERRICRRVDNTTSRMGRRQLCLTARAWRERQ